MKILVIADIHGDFQTLEKILDKSPGPDLVVCPGNFIDAFKLPPEFSQLDIADLILQKLLSLGKPLLCVPGNHDPPETLDLFEDYKINLHAKLKPFKGLQFLGYGGAHTPFNTLFEPTEEEVKEALNSLSNSVKNPLVLVVHNPPKNTKSDQLSSGKHVGSQAIRDFILAKKPILTLTAHIHEAAGQDILGGTVIFNPGPAFQGKFGLVEIGKTIKCKTLKLQ